MWIPSLPWLAGPLVRYLALIVLTLWKERKLDFRRKNFVLSGLVSLRTTKTAIAGILFEISNHPCCSVTGATVVGVL